MNNQDDGDERKAGRETAPALQRRSMGYEHYRSAAVWLLGLLGLAAAYLVTGKLGLLLAIPPGYATAVWPPSGVALAVLLIYGYRFWPGILLGSFIVNLGVSFDTGSALAMLRSIGVAATIGVGASLQGVAGAYLIRRFVGYPTALDEKWDVGRLAILGGPASCLINATWSVGTLLLAGAISPEQFGFSWLAWWIGDTTGVLIVVPLALVWLGEPRERWRRRRVLVTAPLCLTFALAIVVFVQVSEWEQEQVQRDFADEAVLIGDRLSSRIDRYVEVLRSLTDFHAASERVERHEFREYVARLLARYPGILALSWNLRLSDSARAGFEATTRQDGFAQFRVTERDARRRLVPAAVREEYIVVHYIEPYRPNQAAHGLDVASEPSQRAALTEARDSGEPVGTPVIQLVQDNSQAFHVFAPVYRKASRNTSVEQRRRNLTGYVTGIFRVGDAVAAAMLDPESGNFTVELFEASAAGAAPFFSTQATPIGATIAWEKSIDVAARRWLLRISATPAYVSTHRSWQAWWVEAGGLLFTGLLGAVLLVITGRTEKVEALAGELAGSNRALRREMAQHEQSATELRRIGRARTVMAECNHVLVHAKTEPRMLDDMCRIIVGTGGYRLAWVGYAEHDERKTVRPVAQFGFDGGLDTMPNLLGPISWADNEMGRGAVGTAIRTGAPCVKRRFASNPDLAPWRAEALRRDYVSVMTFPLYVEHATIGAFAIYSSDPDAFNPAEIELLSELATDVGFGIELLRIATARGAAEDALREREAGLRHAQSMTKTGYVITGPGGAFESWSETLEQVLGVDAMRMPVTTRDWLVLVHPDDLERVRAHTIAAGMEGERTELEYRIRYADGRWIELRQVTEPLAGARDTPGRRRWFNTIQDVSEQRGQQQRIVRLNRIYAVLSGINSAIVRIHNRQALLDEACRIAVGEGAFKLAWIRSVDADSPDLSFAASFGGEPGYLDGLNTLINERIPVGERLSDVAVRERRPVIRNDVAADAALAPISAMLLDAGVRSCAVLPLVVDGRTTAVFGLLAGEPGFFDDEEIKLLDELAGDIAFGLQYIDKEEKLSYLAYYDALTGLANSALFHDRLTQFLSRAGHQRTTVAVLLIDLDHFTHLNDTFGRHIGDRLLQHAADRFRAELREPFSLARIGADAFAVAVVGLHRGADAATIFSERLHRALAEPVDVDGAPIRLSARAGIALFPDDGQDAATLFKNAEAALKQAQFTGERFLYYTPAINARVTETLAMESRLREAVEREQFVLHYQPKIDTQSGRLVGLEALVRWNDPHGGLVAPGLFIPVLEKSGLILEVGRWVLRQSLRDYRRWQNEKLHPPRIAVNVSSVQFRRQDLADVMRSELERAGVASAALELEITESLIMENIEANTLALKTISDMGIKIALDDFGTGYSSLGYLAQLPVDSLKIDRSFIGSMTQEPESMAIVSAVISLAHAMKLAVVAEGVESEEQARLLARLNCDEMQGYLFSRPVPADEISRMLRTEGGWQVGYTGRLPQVRTLLALDDDPNFLSLLEHALRDEGYRLLTARNVAEAFDAMARNEVGVLMCDQRMPGMSGVEFLGKVRLMYPNTVRLLCSGYPDFEAALAAINLGAVYKFVIKSDDPTELRNVLREAFTARVGAV